MKILKYILIFSLLLLLIYPGTSSGQSGFGINTNNSDWQESESFKTTLKGYEVNNNFPEKKWWLQFNDPVLADYIEQAVRDNQDINIAMARIDEAKYNARAVMGSEFPQLTWYGIFTRLKSSSNFLTPNLAGTPAASTSVLSGGTSNLYITPLVAKYEFDYLLKNHSRTKSAKKDAESMQFNYQTTLITLTTEVATAYLNLLKADKLLALNTELLGYLEQSLELKKSLFKEGEASYDDVLLNEQAISDAKSNISDALKLQGLAVHQLCILMGKAPLEQSSLPRSDYDSIIIDKEIQIGFPSELITRRPDILSAEAQMDKAGIDVSVARKNLFPSLTVYGLFGYASSNLDKLFNWKSNLASITSSLAQSIFTGGTKMATLRAYKSAAKAAVQEYRKAILAAFQDVEDSLSKMDSDYIKYNESGSQVLASQQLLALTNSRLQEGENSYLDVIDSKQQLIKYQQTQTQAKTDLLIDNISLYKALGGGF